MPGVDETGVTVGVAARRAGVTARTLRHWEHVGLVRPSGRTHAGYRLYSAADLDRIARVQAYQRAGLTLQAIGALLDGAPDQVGPAITEQRRELAERIGELKALDAQLEQLAQAHERGILLDAGEQADVFGADWDPTHTVEARERWAGTLQWAQFAERSAGRTREDWAAIAAAMRDFEQALATAAGR